MGETATSASPSMGVLSRRVPPVLALAFCVAVVAAETALSWLLLDHRLPDIVMLYLLGVALIAMRFGYAPSLITAVLSVGAFDFFFTVPYFSFSVADKSYVLTFAIMLFVAFVISNLTERVRRQGALATAREMEIQRERLRNALLSSVSHDLRTPLAVVKGTVTALLDGENRLSAARQHEYLETISAEASRLNRLVRNLLDMTSVEAGALRVRKEWQPLEEVVGVALNRLEEQLADRPVEVKIPAEVALVPMDATLIEQVLVNLVENALKYTPAGAPIAIRARSVENGVEVEVADQGPGVPAEQEELVFEKFHRAAQNPSVAGMGLGLAICRGIISVHGGRIWYEKRSGADGGASFRFVLPRQVDAPPMNALPEAVGDP
jgi:K+-sensing histidine kinase KdpD